MLDFDSSKEIDVFETRLEWVNRCCITDEFVSLRHCQGGWAEHTLLLSTLPSRDAAVPTKDANVAWKAFPSMLCGNASVMKPSEDTPATAEQSVEELRAEVDRLRDELAAARGAAKPKG